MGNNRGYVDQKVRGSDGSRRKKCLARKLKEKPVLVGGSDAIFWYGSVRTDVIVCDKLLCVDCVFVGMEKINEKEGRSINAKTALPALVVAWSSNFSADRGASATAGRGIHG